MSDKTKFDYLLNALELASQCDKPAQHGYGEKRRALFAYVRALEDVAEKAQEVARSGRSEIEDALDDLALAIRNLSSSGSASVGGGQGS